MLKRALLPLVVALVAYGHVSGKWLHWDCPVRVLTHHMCPTCGMTTAARAMLEFHFAEATRIHPLALVVIPFVTVLASVELAGYVVTGEFGAFTNRNAVRIAGVAMCAALFLVWIARLCGVLTPS